MLTLGLHTLMYWSPPKRSSDWIKYINVLFPVVLVHILNPSITLDTPGTADWAFHTKEIMRTVIRITEPKFIITNMSL